MKKVPIFLLTPNNFSHKAGDGTKTRKREIRLIHPALQATPGSTQCTYLLECWEKERDNEDMGDKIVCERRFDEGLRMFKGETIGAIRTIDSGGDKRVIENKDNQCGYRIRKLTPKECWRLMGFEDVDFDKAKSAGVSNSQLYKQAGNSIVVDVLYYIFKNLYIAMPYLFEDLKVGSYFSGIGAFEKGLDRLYKDINYIKPINSLSADIGNNAAVGGEL